MRNVYNLSIRAWLLSLLCLLVGGRAVANEPQLPKPTDDHITVNEVTLVPGSTDTYQVEISLVGSQTYTAFQMDIVFPPGVEPVLMRDVYVKLFNTDDNDLCSSSHTIGVSYGAIKERTLRMSCASLQNTSFYGKSGKLLYFLVKASPYLKPGDVVLKVTNLDFITKENAQKYHCKDQTLTLHAKAESTATLSVSGSLQPLWHLRVAIRSVHIARRRQGLFCQGARRHGPVGGAQRGDATGCLYTLYII